MRLLLASATDRSHRHHCSQALSIRRYSTTVISSSPYDTWRKTVTPVTTWSTVFGIDTSVDEVVVLSWLKPAVHPHSINLLTCALIATWMSSFRHVRNVFALGIQQICQRTSFRLFKPYICFQNSLLYRILITRVVILPRQTRESQRELKRRRLQLCLHSSIMWRHNSVIGLATAFYSVSQKTGPLRLIWHNFTSSQCLLIIFGTDRPYSIFNWLRWKIFKLA